MSANKRIYLAALNVLKNEVVYNQVWGLVDCDALDTDTKDEFKRVATYLRSGEEIEQQESVGALKEHRKAQHLCVNCQHFSVCAVAAEIHSRESFFVTISDCNAFLANVEAE